MHAGKSPFPCTLSLTQATPTLPPPSQGAFQSSYWAPLLYRICKGHPISLSGCNPRCGVGEGWGEVGSEEGAVFPAYAQRRKCSHALHLLPNPWVSPPKEQSTKEAKYKIKTTIHGQFSVQNKSRKQLTVKVLLALGEHRPAPAAFPSGRGFLLSFQKVVPAHEEFVQPSIQPDLSPKSVGKSK